MLNILLMLINLSFSKDLTAQEIAKDVYYSNRPKTTHQIISMKVYPEDSTREFKSTTITNQIYNSKSLIVFTAPNKFKKIGLYTENNDKNSNQYVYLPALRKIRKISTKNKSGRFVNSDLYYQDLTTDKYNNYHYKILKKENDLVQLESIPKDKSSTYSKTISTVDLKKKMIIITKFYINNKLEKELKVLESKKYSTHWLPTHVEITGVKSKTKTILKTKELKIDIKVDKEGFNKNLLKKF